MRNAIIVAGVVVVAAGAFLYVSKTTPPNTSAPAASKSSVATYTYKVDSYLDLPEGRKWGPVTAMDFAPDGQSMWVVDRCTEMGDCSPNAEPGPIQQFNATGRRMTSFGAGLFAAPHGMFVDHDGNVYVTDFRLKDGKGSTVMKFDPEGKLLLTLGKPGEMGHDETLLNGPADVVVAQNGDIFVADGHAEKDAFPRIVKFDKDGKFIKAWGQPGKGPGEFGTPHSIMIDSEGHVLVCDRGNFRIQVFDQDGNYLRELKSFMDPSAIAIDNNGVLYAFDMSSVEKDGSNDRRGIYIGDPKTDKLTGFMKNDDMLEDLAIDSAGTVFAGSNAKKTFNRIVRE